jgi:hypothetical protein
MVFAVVAGNAAAADRLSEPNSLPTKEGWSDARIAEFSRGCTEGILAPARRDYFARAAAVGDLKPKPFPETEVRASVAPMCSCLTLRFAQTWTFDDFLKNQEALSQPLIKEAMRGGQCKPGGILGAALEKK